jgi:hypothetical protein
VLVVDSRAARVLADGRRDMVDDDEWEWIIEHSRGAFDHLVIVSSMPVFLSPGVHYLEAWSEALCAGAWGGLAARLGEKLRRALDLEHWPAFQRSFERMMPLLRDAAEGSDGHDPPASITVVGGDVHNAYVAEVSLGRFRHAAAACTRSSAPFRNPLGPAGGAVAVTKTRAAAVVVGGLARLAGVRRPSARWRYRAGPTFDNSIRVIELDGRWAGVTIFRAEPGSDGRLLPLHTRVLADGPRATAQERAESASR